MAYIYQPSKTFSPIPEGVHAAVLVGVYELGMQPGYQDEGLDPKLILDFEMPEEPCATMRSRFIPASR